MPVYSYKFSGREVLAANSGSVTTVPGALTVLGNLNAPIVYDSDNTTYNVNPAATSTLTTLGVTGACSALIFYNYGSTAYYVNPGSTSKLNTLETTGRVGINQPSPSYPLHVNASVSGTSIYASADIVAYSDVSVKENIRLIENVIERIQQSRGVLYDRIDIDSKNNIGFIAQELEVAFPELIVTNEDGTKAVKYQNTVAVLFEAIKDQQRQIDELKQIVDGINR